MVKLPRFSAQSSNPQISVRRAILQAMTLPIVLYATQTSAVLNAPVTPGDVVVVDTSAGTDDRGAVFAVKKTSGKRRLLSDFGDPAQGELGITPASAAFESMHSLVAVDVNGGTGLSGALYRIDTLSGQRSILSDFGDSKQGPLGVNPSGVAVEKSGSLLVIDASAGSDHRGRLFRVDAQTGERTILSDFSNVAQGELGVTPASVAVDTSGQILVTDANLLPGAAGLLFKIDPVTGMRTVVSNFGDPVEGPLGVDPASLTIDRQGKILVIDPGSPFGGSGAKLFQVDPASGERTTLSDFADAKQGATDLTPTGVAVDQSGKILVLDPDAGETQSGALLRIDRREGKSQLISDFGVENLGVVGSDPVSLAVPPGLAFKHFKFKLKLDPAGGWLWIRGQFMLDRHSDGIDMLKDFVRLQLGDDVHLLPPSACAILSGRAIKCEASMGATSVAVLVRALGRQRYTFNIVARGIDVAKLQQVLPFGLTIGNEMGAGLLRLKQKLN